MAQSVHLKLVTALLCHVHDSGWRLNGHEVAKACRSRGSVFALSFAFAFRTFLLLGLSLSLLGDRLVVRQSKLRLRLPGNGYLLAFRGRCPGTVTSL